MAHNQATHDTKEELLEKIIALMKQSTEGYSISRYRVVNGLIVFRDGKDEVNLNPDAALIRMKIWAARVRKTADLIDDVSTAWEIMKVPTELNKTDWNQDDITLEKAIDRFLETLLERGWSKPKILTAFAELYEQ